MRLGRRGCRFLIAGLIAPRAAAAAQSTGLVAALGHECFFPTVAAAIDAAMARQNVGDAGSGADDGSRGAANR